VDPERRLGWAMSGRSIETTYEGSGWVNRIQDGPTLGRHATKDEAVVEGRRLAMQRRTEHIVYSDDGRLESRSDYR
jgi:hypothetical protein